MADHKELFLSGVIGAEAALKLQERLESLRDDDVAYSVAVAGLRQVALALRQAQAVSVEQVVQTVTEVPTDVEAQTAVVEEAPTEELAPRVEEVSTSKIKAEDHAEPAETALAESAVSPAEVESQAERMSKHAYRTLEKLFGSKNVALLTTKDIPAIIEAVNVLYLPHNPKKKSAVAQVDRLLGHLKGINDFEMGESCDPPVTAGGIRLGRVKLIEIIHSNHTTQQLQEVLETLLGDGDQQTLTSVEEPTADIVIATDPSIEAGKTETVEDDGVDTYEPAEPLAADLINLDELSEIDVPEQSPREAAPQESSETKVPIVIDRDQLVSELEERYGELVASGAILLFDRHHNDSEEIAAFRAIIGRLMNQYAPTRTHLENELPVVIWSCLNDLIAFNVSQGQRPQRLETLAAKYHVKLNLRGLNSEEAVVRGVALLVAKDKERERASGRRVARYEPTAQTAVPHVPQPRAHVAAETRVERSPLQDALTMVCDRLSIDSSAREILEQHFTSRTKKQLSEQEAFMLAITLEQIEAALSAGIKRVRGKDRIKSDTSLLVRQLVGNEFGLKPVDRADLPAKLASGKIFEALAELSSAEIDRELVNGLQWIVKNTPAHR